MPAHPELRTRCMSWMDNALKMHNIKQKSIMKTVLVEFLKARCFGAVSVGCLVLLSHGNSDSTLHEAWSLTATASAPSFC